MFCILKQHNYSMKVIAMTDANLCEHCDHTVIVHTIYFSFIADSEQADIARMLYKDTCHEVSSTK